MSVEYDDWHFNVRASNTEPLESGSISRRRRQALMEEKRDQVLGVDPRLKAGRLGGRRLEARQRRRLQLEIRISLVQCAAIQRAEHSGNALASQAS